MTLILDFDPINQMAFDVFKENVACWHRPLIVSYCSLYDYSAVYLSPYQGQSESSHSSWFLKRLERKAFLHKTPTYATIQYKGESH